MNILILFLITSASASCCNGRFGKHVNNNDWSNYVSNIKKQITGDCWAQASTSYLEIVYAYKTGYYFRFSATQIVDNIMQVSGSCSSDGGNFACAMGYVKTKGLMTEVDYAKYGYDIRHVVPMQVLDIKQNYHMMEYDDFILQLNREPIVVYMHMSPTRIYFENTINISHEQNHAVVAMNVCQFNNNTYIEYLNSYGSDWGNCNGMGYIRISDDSGFFVNNAGIFSWQNSANIGKTYWMYTFDDNLWVTIGLQCGQLLLQVILITLAMTCIMRKN